MSRHLPMDEELLAKIDKAIGDVHAAFGAPGGYGYSTPKGDALFALYRLRVSIVSDFAAAKARLRLADPSR